MVQRLDVEFQSEGDTVRGWLYTPDEGGRRPTVALAGGWCYVREVTMPTYAQKLAENGFNALIIDYRNFGVSRSEEHTSELQSLMRSSYAVFSLNKNTFIHYSKLRHTILSYTHHK